MSFNNKAQMKEQMQKLITYGTSFSLDDYGTGNSNISYLIDFQFIYVKLDKSLKNAFLSNPKAKSLINPELKALASLGYNIIIEGVESLLEAASLASEGITYMQGYYFSKPKCIEEFLLDIKNRSK